MDCLPEYSKEAEGLLSKALKQDPTTHSSERKGP